MSLASCWMGFIVARLFGFLAARVSFGLRLYVRIGRAGWREQLGHRALVPLAPAHDKPAEYEHANAFSHFC